MAGEDSSTNQPPDARHVELRSKRNRWLMLVPFAVLVLAGLIVVATSGARVDTVNHLLIRCTQSGGFAGVSSNYFCVSYGQSLQANPCGSKIATPEQAVAVAKIIQQQRLMKAVSSPPPTVADSFMYEIEIEINGSRNQFILHDDGDDRSKWGIRVKQMNTTFDEIRQVLNQKSN